MTRTCDRCKHTAPVDDFTPFRFVWDGVQTTTYTCPKCGAIRTTRETVK